MKIKLVIPVISLALSLLMIWMVIPWSADNADAATSREATATTATPAVLVELFTSEGCSTCPPADKLLADFDQAQLVEGAQVIALSEHVDYWNQLGWKDPFSSAEFSQRQTDYALALSMKDIYTPQMIVDGQTAFVGSKLDAARQAIAKAARSPKADVNLTLKTATPKAVKLTVQVENVPDVSPGDSAEVMLAITESGLLSQVLRGENSGRKLMHAAVTRKLIRIGTIKGKTFSIEPAIDLDRTWKRQNMKAVAFVQERTSRRVLGTAAIKLAGEL
jgi:hypothetical protein